MALTVSHAFVSSVTDSTAAADAGEVLPSNWNANHVISGEATGANPTATAADTAVNGSASTFMRSDAAPAVQKATASQFGIVEVDGTTITASGGVITTTTATTSQLGIVKPDNSTITASAGVISATTATTSQLGVVKPDGSTITIAGGVITAAGGAASLTVNSSPISGGAAGQILYDNGGTLEETPLLTINLDASGTNTAATALTIRAPLSTGDATNPDIVFKTGVAGSSGSSPGTATEGLRLSGEAQTLTLTCNSASVGGRTFVLDDYNSSGNTSLWFYNQGTLSIILQAGSSSFSGGSPGVGIYNAYPGQPTSGFSIFEFSLVTGAGQTNIAFSDATVVGIGWTTSVFSSGTPSPGFGSADITFLEDSGGHLSSYSALETVLTDATSGAGSCEYTIQTTLAGTAAAGLKVNDHQGVEIGNSALSTSAADGFLYIPTCAGTPTGTPKTVTGRIAMVYDTTNHQFWFYDGGWKQPKTPAAAAIITWQ